MADRETTGVLEGHFADGGGHTANEPNCPCNDRAIRAAYDLGFQLGAKVENRVARKALTAAVLEVLGKDYADGPVDLGALGTCYAR